MFFLNLIFRFTFLLPSDLDLPIFFFFLVDFRWPASSFGSSGSDTLTLAAGVLFLVSILTLFISNDVSSHFLTSAFFLDKLRFPWTLFVSFVKPWFFSRSRDFGVCKRWMAWSLIGSADTQTWLSQNSIKSLKSVFLKRVFSRDRRNHSNCDETAMIQMKRRWSNNFIFQTTVKVNHGRLHLTFVIVAYVESCLNLNWKT